MTNTTMTNTLQDHLTSLELERCRCLMAQDIDGLRKLLSERLLHIHTRGNVHDLGQYLHFVQEVVQVLALGRADLTVRELGDNAAVMLGRQSNQSKSRATGATMVTEAQVVQVWVREQDGAWRLSVFQGTALPEGQ